MSNRIVHPSFGCLILYAAALVPSGQAQTHVEVIATALHHVTVVQVPEMVDNVALGSSQVHVEWHGKNILIEPQKVGIDTNMVVFTHRTTYLYEIAAASEPGAMSWLVKEKGPAPPPPPTIPDPYEIQKEHDQLYTGLLMNIHSIDSRKIHPQKHSVSIRVVQVAEDSKNYYVRLSAVNKTSHTYRLQNGMVMKIDPAFGADMAYRNINHQIGPNEFKEFQQFRQSAILSHGSTLDTTDMPPDTTMDWVVALTKPEITPAIIRWTFAEDQGTAVDAVAIF